MLAWHDLNHSRLAWQGTMMVGAGLDLLPWQNPLQHFRQFPNEISSSTGNACSWEELWR
jgi:hypothetical protein